MYRLLEDPTTAVNDDDLRHAIPIRTCVSISNFCGIPMVWGNLRTQGIKVTWERVRNVKIYLEICCDVYQVQEGLSSWTQFIVVHLVRHVLFSLSGQL